MRETRKKDNVRAIIGTAIVHGLMLLWFVFFGLSTPLPLPEEEGVLVSLGYQDQGTGRAQPLTSSPPPETSVSQASSDREAVATQESEETVSLPEVVPEAPVEQPKEESPEDQQEEPQPEEAELAEPEPPKPQVDPRALFPGEDQRSTNQQSQGETNQAGNQGAASGAISGDNFTGSGQGNGIDYDLKGRHPNHLPMPSYTTQAQGKVVVTIFVNPQGQVVRAEPGARGTTTSDPTLHRLAGEAALKARFDVKESAAHEQRGTITYNFIRLN